MPQSPTRSSSRSWNPMRLLCLEYGYCEGSQRQRRAARVAGAGRLVAGGLIDGRKPGRRKISRQRNALLLVRAIDEEDSAPLRGNESLHNRRVGAAGFLRGGGDQLVARMEVVVNQLQYPVTRIRLAVVVVDHRDAGKLRR